MAHDNAYFQMIHSTWGERLRQVFGEIPDPEWAPIGTLPGGTAAALPPRAAWPAAVVPEPSAVQSVAQTGNPGQAGGL